MTRPPSEGRTAVVDLDELAGLPQVADAAPVGTFLAAIGGGASVSSSRPMNGSAPRSTGSHCWKADVLIRDSPMKRFVSFTLSEQYDIGVGDEITLVDPSYAEIPRTRPLNVVSSHQSEVSKRANHATVA